MPLQQTGLSHVRLMIRMVRRSQPYLSPLAGRGRERSERVMGHRAEYAARIREIPLTRFSRCARKSTSPRKRGELHSRLTHILLPTHMRKLAGRRRYVNKGPFARDRQAATGPHPRLQPNSPEFSCRFRRELRRRAVPHAEPHDITPGRPDGASSAGRQVPWRSTTRSATTGVRASSAA